MVHADDMNMFNRAPPRSDDEQQAELEAAAEPATEPTAAIPPSVVKKSTGKSKFQVAETMDEKGRLQGGGDHQYLIRWEGTGQWSVVERNGSAHENRPQI